MAIAPSTRRALVLLAIIVPTVALAALLPVGRHGRRSAEPSIQLTQAPDATGLLGAAPDWQPVAPRTGEPLGRTAAGVSANVAASDDGANPSTVAEGGADEPACDHYFQVSSDSERAWHTALWKLSRVAASGEESAARVSVVRPALDPFGCTLSAYQPEGEYILTHRTTGWQVPVMLGCDGGNGSRLDLHMPSTARVMFHPLDERGAPVHGLNLSVCLGAVGEGVSASVRDLPTGAWSAELVPGRYQVLVQGASQTPIVMPFDVESGPLDIVIDMPSVDRFTVTVKATRDGEAVPIPRREIMAKNSAGESVILGVRGKLFGAGQGERPAGSQLEDHRRISSDEILAALAVGFRSAEVDLRGDQPVSLLVMGQEVALDATFAGTLVELELP